MGGRGTPVKKIPIRQLNKELQQEMQELKRQMEAEEAAKRAAEEAAKAQAEAQAKAEAEAKKKAEEEAKKKAEEEKKKKAQKKVQKKQESQKIDFTDDFTQRQITKEFVEWFNSGKTKKQFEELKPSSTEIDEDGYITVWTGLTPKFAKTKAAKEEWAFPNEGIKMWFKIRKKKANSKKKFGFEFAGSKQ